jgi:prevent-host-death family protein
MQIYTTSQARNKLFTLVDDVNNYHEPIYIKGKSNEAVMLSKEEYESLLETMHIYSVPGWVDRILEASKEPIEDSVSHEDAWK